MQKLKVGVVGCGVIGRKHVEAAASLPQVELIAIADVNEVALKEVATQFDVPKTYTSAEALLQDRSIEAVVLALPTSIRGNLALEAIEQKKHVLLEKPASMHAAELESLREAQKGQVIACASSRFALYDSAAEAAKVVASGVLGQLRLVR